MSEYLESLKSDSREHRVLIPYKDAQKYSEFLIPERTQEKIQNF